MRGHIAKKGTRYYIVISRGKDEETGKRDLKWMPGGYDRKKDAEDALPDILRSLKHGTLVEPTKETLSTFMTTWLEQKKSEVRPGTWKAYRWLVNTHLIPHLGKKQIVKLESQDFRKLYHETLFKVKKLAASSIRKLHVLILDALNRAVEDRKLTQNVATVVKTPQGKAAKFEVWDEQQLDTFLAAALSDPYYIVFELAASTGMRQSEILGLRRRDVDLKTKMISVRQAYTKAEKGHDFDDTKNPTSERSIALFSSSVALLEAHFVKQEEIIEQHRIKKEELLRKFNNNIPTEILSMLYNDHGLVAQSNNGTPINPRNLMRNYYKIRETLKIPRIRFHDLRHTHATILLKRGVHPKIVQERLGHSSITVTLDTYSHVLPNLQEAVLRGLGDSITSTSSNISSNAVPSSNDSLQSLVTVEP